MRSSSAPVASGVRSGSAGTRPNWGTTSTPTAPSAPARSLRSRIVCLAASRSAGSALKRRGIPSIAETEIGEAANASWISAAGRRRVPVWSSTASSPTDSSQASFSGSVSWGIIPSRIETFMSSSSLWVFVSRFARGVGPISPHHPDTMVRPTATRHDRMPLPAGHGTLRLSGAGMTAKSDTARRRRKCPVLVHGWPRCRRSRSFQHRCWPTLWRLPRLRSLVDCVSGTNSPRHRIDNVDAIYAAFTEQNPNITITREAISSDQMRDMVNTAIASGTGPDIIFYEAGPGYAGVLADAGLILPLDDYAAESAGKSGSRRQRSRPRQ